MEIFLGVDSDGVEFGGFYMDVDAIFKKAKLFQAFGLLEETGRQSREALKGGFAVGIEAYVFPIPGRDSVTGLSITIKGDGGAGEVEGAAVVGGDYFYGIGVGDVFWSAEDFEGGDFDVMLGEGAKECGEVLGLE